MRRTPAMRGETNRMTDPQYQPPGQWQPTAQPPAYGAPPAAQGYPQPPYYAAPPPKKKSRVGLVLGVIALGLLVLCGGGVLIAVLAGGGGTARTAGGGDNGQNGAAAGTHKLNEPVRDGKFEFVVKSVT